MPNFNILQAIQPPSVVATLPTMAPQPSQLDSLASGIMGGMAQGQQIAESRQRMDQNAQMFPGQLKLQQQQIQGNDQTLQSGAIDLKNKQVQFQALEAGRAQAKNGYQAAIKAISAHDPALGIKMQQDYADMMTKQGQAAQELAKGNKAQLSALYDIQMTGGQMAATALSMATDQQTGQIDWNKANAAYQQTLAPLRKTSPELAKLYPDQLTPDAAANLTFIGHNAMLNQAQTALSGKDNRTDKQKNAEAIAALKDSIKNGTATQKDKDTLASLEQQTAPPKYVNSPADTALISSYGKELDRINQAKASAPQFYGRLTALRDAVEKTPALLQGPVGQHFAWLNRNAQDLIGNANALVGQIKNIQNWGSQGFTDADRRFVAATIGGIQNYKGSTLDLLNGLESLQKHSDRYNWLQENRIMSETKDYDNWKEGNPEPSVVIQTPQGKMQLPITQYQKLQKDHPKEKFEVVD